VIVAVVGSSVNPVDWKLIEERLFPGIPAAFPAKLGTDMAGVVHSVGKGCTRLKPGDRVWADLADDGLGAYATYAKADESHLGLIPAGLAWDSASVLPLVSMTSLAALKATGAPWQTSKKPVVMVLGGSGGCGFTGIQIAKAFGASEIWTTTSFLNFDFVRSMGATKAFDYQTEDWTKIVPANSVDVVYDTVGVAGSAQKAMRAIQAGGWYVTIAGDTAPNPKVGVKQQFIHKWPKNATVLDEISTLVSSGKLIAEIQSVYSIYEMTQAFDDSAGGQVVGKLFINTTYKPDTY
jgi:NADPH:quinone reductase-like Zn-dependent oxidoreductase